MPDPRHGESVEMKGSGSRPYVLKNVGGVYSCSDGTIVPTISRPACLNWSRHGTFLVFSLWRRTQADSLDKMG